MDVFGAGTEEGSRPLLPPGLCWICDQSPTQEAIKVIDTRRNARPGGPLVHESVRKYICEDCIVELGHAIGMVSADKYHNALTYHEIASKRVRDLEDELAEARSQQTRVVDPDELTDGFIAAVKAAVAEEVASLHVPASSE